MTETRKVNSNDRLIALLLEQCMMEFEQLKGTAGCWPESAVIVLKDSYHHRFFGLGKPARAWISNGDTLTEIYSSETEKYLTSECDRIYYRTARFTIAVPDDMSVARMVASFGPRFGAIYLYDVICDGDNVSLGERRCVGMM